ncbi:hypothetical protein M2322_002659 [Rhodoblastus acidophilus]|uniref:hypothetical protein n=1 Tax=Rhodoblastus acidophilus TaxID=1074 RepID=UPI002225280A|nr:hypothetical protein [Rhodoblastus acidophilus]MCW2317105.1 hypothetical protein [Rhodoblastus acidophilus]
MSRVSNAPFGIRNIARLPSNSAGLSASLITPTNEDSPRRLYFVLGQVNSVYTVYLKLYDLARAPVVGTDAPLMTLPLSSNIYWNGSSGIAAPDPFEFSFDGVGVTFLHGIAYALTKNPADNDTAALAAGDVTGLNLAWA